MPRTTSDPQAAYRERLWPGPTVWLLTFAVVAALAVAYANAVGSLAGWAIVVVGTLFGLGMISRSAVRVAVEPDGLRAGRAFLEWESMGRVVALDGAGARTARGPQGDASAYLLLRPGVGPGAVVLEVLDPLDPHRTWLVASRHPERMASAIENTRGRVTP